MKTFRGNKKWFVRTHLALNFLLFFEITRRFVDVFYVKKAIFEAQIFRFQKSYFPYFFLRFFLKSASSLTKRELIVSVPKYPINNIFIQFLFFEKTKKVDIFYYYLS